MRRSLFITVTAMSLALAGFSVRADPKDELQREVRQVNAAAKSVGMETALQRISVETGVPVERVQAMHKQHPNANVASLMLSTVLADETKKDPEFFLKQRIEDDRWTTVAREHNVPLEKLSARLDRLQKAMSAPADKPAKPGRKR